MDQLLTFIDHCLNVIVQTTIVLSIGFILFSLLERIFSLHPLKKPWRSTQLDLSYAFISMFFPPFIYFVMAAIFGLEADQVKGAAHNPHLPLLSYASQMFIVLFVRDGLIYLRHRIFHTRPVWPFHSIHHSSEEVNWLSAARFHPTENILEATGEILWFLCCKVIGFDPLVLAVSAGLIGFYNLFIHSNLRWTFGPLRYVLVSPVFHRWHHSDSVAARDKNFAAMFSVIDLALGTFYMPKNEMPETTGLSAEEKAAHPRTLGGQLFYPFRKR